MKISKGYFISIILLMLVLPLASIIVDVKMNNLSFDWALTGKWFTFWAVGIRLFIAGVRQAIQPSFTAESIFHITDKQSFVIVKELGFSNICFGALGIISIFAPSWRLAAAFTGGLYLGIAGFYHIIRKPSNANEILAMVSDIFMFLLLAVYIIMSLAQ